MAKKHPLNTPLRHRPFATLAKALEERGLLTLCASIAVDHHATVNEVLTGSRLPHVVRARWAFAWQLRCNVAYGRMSYNTIAELLDQEHTTIIDAVRKHQELIDERVRFAQAEAISQIKLR